MRSHRLWLVPVSALRLGCLLMALTCGCASMPGTRVVGYMPAWKGLRQTVENTDLEPLTHINIAFLNPDTSGAFVEGREPLCMRGATAQELDHLVERAHAADVRVLVSLGGGLIPECSGDWEALLVPERRSEMVEALVHFAETFELDGIDVDLEGRLLTAIDEAGNYTPFVEQLSAALQPSGKLVTCATASYTGGMIPVESIPFFDFVNIIAPVNAVVSLDDEVLEDELFEPITPEYRVARRQIEDGVHRVSSDARVAIVVYGYDQYVSYGYPGGLDLRDLKLLKEDF